MHCPAFSDAEIQAKVLELHSKQIRPTLENCQSDGLVCDRQRFYRLITPEWKKVHGIKHRRCNPPSNRSMHYRSPVVRSDQRPQPEPVDNQMRPPEGTPADSSYRYWHFWPRRRLGLAVPLGVEA